MLTTETKEASSSEISAEAIREQLGLVVESQQVVPIEG
jgi:hypothetical protein